MIPQDAQAIEIQEVRTSNYSINPLILYRWSPRAMSGEKMTDEETLPLFEAARWAPSSSNKQPWLFLYAKKGTPEWDTYYDLLVDFNKQWCKNASVLVIVLSRTVSENDHPIGTHSYDTGAAWMSIALEGSSRNLVVHGIGGFDSNQARKKLQIPNNYAIEAMAAIGKPAPKQSLPPNIQKMEVPSSRKSLQEVAVHGKFPH